MKLSLLIVMVTALVACSGGRQRISRNGHCFDKGGVGYSPVPVEIAVNGKYSLAEFTPTLSTSEKSALEKAINQVDIAGELADPEDFELIESFEESLDLTETAPKVVASKLPSGSYYFNSADIFIEKTDPTLAGQNKVMKIHLQQLRKGDKDQDISNDERVLSNKCVSNMPVDGKIDPILVGAITDFSVNKGTSIESDKQQDYLVSFDNNQLLREVVTINKGLVKAPKAYLKDAGMTYKLYKFDGPDFQYELRSVKESTNLKIYVAVRYTYVETKVETAKSPEKEQ